MISRGVGTTASSRRRFLHGVGVGLTVGLAGCTGGTPAVSGDDGPGGDTGGDTSTPESTPTPEPTPTPENESTPENAFAPDVVTAIPTTAESTSDGGSGTGGGFGGGSGGGASSAGGASGSWTSNHPDGRIHEVTCDGDVVSARHVRNYPDRNLRIRERELYLRLILIDESTGRSKLETVGPVPTKSDGSLDEALVSFGDYDVGTADHTITQVHMLVRLEGGGFTGIGGNHTASVAC